MPYGHNVKSAKTRQVTESMRIYWVLECYTLILFLVLGSYCSYLYLKSIYFFQGLLQGWV